MQHYFFEQDLLDRHLEPSFPAGSAASTDPKLLEQAVQQLLLHRRFEHTESKLAADQYET